MDTRYKSKVYGTSGKERTVANVSRQLLLACRVLFCPVKEVAGTSKNLFPGYIEFLVMLDVCIVTFR
jgi:hypothetical protein